MKKIKLVIVIGLTILLIGIPNFSAQEIKKELDDIKLQNTCCGYDFEVEITVVSKMKEYYVSIDRVNIFNKVESGLFKGHMILNRNCGTDIELYDRVLSMIEIDLFMVGANEPTRYYDPSLDDENTASHDAYNNGIVKNDGINDVKEYQPNYILKENVRGKSLGVTVRLFHQKFAWADVGGGYMVWDDILTAEAQDYNKEPYAVLKNRDLFKLFDILHVFPVFERILNFLS
jgi:hypothetical protein